MECVRLTSSHINSEGEKEEDIVIDLRDSASIDQIVRMRDAMRARAALELGEIAGRDADIELIPTD
jgi:hypothetical protein